MTERIYVAGPMRGYPNLNFDAFNANAYALREEGYEVVNPVEINPDPNAEYLECMRADIKALCDCDAIYLLDGWENSEGANAEYQVARMLKLKVYFERTDD
jgi:hypothetical protein